MGKFKLYLSKVLSVNEGYIVRVCRLECGCVCGVKVELVFEFLWVLFDVWRLWSKIVMELLKGKFLILELGGEEICS